MTERKKVLVAMSGGVDSSAAVLLLQRQGCEVEGATFLLWDGAGEQNVADAKTVCGHLGVRHHILDYRDQFRQGVMEYFAAEYRRGFTPNPCIACNRRIKFGAFLADAAAMGFDRVATGHYVRVLYDRERACYRLKRADSLEKDQSYVLYALGQEQLSRLLTPLGGYSKEDIRRLAEEAGLPVSRKAESQDICFVPDGDYASFLERYTGRPVPPGDFVDSEGQRLAPHRGLWRYTIGQRRGLGVGFGKPLYVTAIDPVSATVTLGDNESLFRTGLIAENAVFTEIPALREPASFDVKIRYGARPCPATVYPLDQGRVRVIFETAQRAVTPGQTVVFYEGDYVAGGATILRAESTPPFS